MKTGRIITLDRKGLGQRPFPGSTGDGPDASRLSRPPHASGPAARWSLPLEPVPGLFAWRGLGAGSDQPPPRQQPVQEVGPVRAGPAGGADAEGGPTVIGLHGWSGSHRTFEPLLPWIPASVSFIAFDQPSFGRSAPPAAWRIEAFVAPLAAAVERVATGPVTLAGNSGGALIALELARLLPGRVARLVLIDPFAYVPWYFGLLARGWPGWFFYHCAFANPLGRFIVNQVLAARRARRTNMLAGFSDVGHRDTYRYLRLLVGLGSAARYREIATRVDLLAGQRTFSAVKRSIALYQRLWPAARTFELAGAGHLPIAEAPERLGAILFGRT